MALTAHRSSRHNAPMGRAADRRSSRGTGRRAVTPTARRGARPQSRRRQPSQPARIGWSRRLGIAAALLVAGVSVVFASQAMGPGGPAATPRDPAATPTPTPAPVLAAAPELLPPSATLTNEPSITLDARLLEDLPRDEFRLRVYVNGDLERERRLPRRQQFSLAVALVEGPNSITLAVSGAGGESLHSAPVEVTRDSRAPAISGLEPASGTTVYAERATLRGTTEPGATLRVLNQATGSASTRVVGEDGAIEVAVDLVLGANELVLETRDAAGNEARAAVSLERREGAPTVELTLSRTSLTLAGLPTSISLRADVLEAGGAPVDGAEVTFSLSPPGVPTLTYNATTVAGVARWPSVRISDAATAGDGLATVLVTLPDGETLTTSVYFSIEE